MMTDQEVLVLELLSSRLLARVSEIKAGIVNGPDGVRTTVQRLVSMDYVKMIEPIGEKCYVITKKGTKVLNELKNPERRAEGRALDGKLTFGQLSSNV